MPETFDIDAMRQAHHDNDPDRLTSFYADDAIVRVVDVTHPPSHPLELKGHDQIRAFMADICSRDMTHEISEAAVGLDTVSWQTRCLYATGERVLATDIAKVREGRIVEDTIVQAWDA